MTSARAMPWAPGLRRAPVALALLAISPALAPGAAGGQSLSLPQSEARTRIWGRVSTTAGAVHEGFIRWDRNEGSWVDLLDGSKNIQIGEFLDWTPAPGAGLRRTDRVIEYGGYRITWRDTQADFPSTAESGVRFGHVERIRVMGGDSVSVELRSGQAMGLNEWETTLLRGPGVRVVLTGGSTDLGPDLRELQVDVPGGDVVFLEWENLVELELGPPPAGVTPRHVRLHGTVEDRSGGVHTGFLAWDSDEAFATDTLDGEGLGERRFRIAFGEVASIRNSLSGALVVLINGDTLRFRDSGDVDSGALIQLSDPGLGQVALPWPEVERVLFHPPEDGNVEAAAWEAFDGGRPLRGAVTTITGEELTGLVVWDADEAFSWEILDGGEGDLTFDVELGKVAAIEKMEGERGTRRGARVTLRDGRILELSGSNDVDAQNKGVLVRALGEGLEAGSAGPWIRVRWADFRSLRLHH